MTKDLLMDKNLRPYLAELIGTFAIVFIGAGVVCTSNMSKVDTQPQLNLLGIALAQGLILAVALAATIGVSGGFLNPAITLTFWVFKRLDGVKTCWLIGAQLLGAILAGMYLRFMFTEDVLRNSPWGLPT